MCLTSYLSRICCFTILGVALLTSGRAAIITPNDPLFPQQWNLSSIGASDAWAITTGSTNIVIVVIDTGVDYTHPDLAPNMWNNPGETGLDANGNDKATNGIDDDGNGYIDDVHGVNVATGSGDPMDSGFWEPPETSASATYHGTFIAGIIGAVGNNSVGVSGLNWTAQIMAINVGGGDLSDLHGESDIPFYRNILTAFDYVLEMKRRGVNIRVVSNSYLTLIPGKALADRMRALEQEDILCVFAAGNFLADLDLYSNYPGTFNFGNVVLVATSDQVGALRPLSPFGRSTVDLAAAGFNITSTTKGGGYVSGYTGTSFACPLVAGAAGLLLAHDASLTVNQLKSALYGSVDQHASLKGKVVTNGRLNVGRAFAYLSDTNPPAIVITALPAGQRTALDESIQVTFNRPMNRASVESALVIQPPLSGRFVWTDDDRTFAFYHDQPFDRTTNYLVRITGVAEDQSGGTLDGDFDRIREGSPSDDFRWTFRFPVPNDDFDNAQLLAGASGQVKGTNQYADWDEAEPQPLERGAQIRGNTVWYRWTAPEQGSWLTCDLSPTSFDSYLDVFAGTEISRLSLATENDNNGFQTASRASLNTLPGTNYMIRVSSKNAFDPGQAGSFTLRWYPTPPPGFTGTQFSPTTAAPGTKITLTGTNFTGATAVLFNGAPASFSNAPANNLDLRITATVPPDGTSGPITILTPHGTITSSASFTVDRPVLTIGQNSTEEVTLSWSEATFVLESSSDLRSWTVLSPAGETTTTLRTDDTRRFFRLSRP